MGFRAAMARSSTVSTYTASNMAASPGAGYYSSLPQVTHYYNGFSTSSSSGSMQNLRQLSVGIAPRSW